MSQHRTEGREMNENTHTRRDFLKAAGVGAATAAIGLSAVAVADKTTPRKVNVAKVQKLLKKQGAYLG
jgi:hypothetical protein